MHSLLLDPTAGGTKCLALEYCPATHILTMQIEHTGTVSRISLTITNPPDFLPPSGDLPSVRLSSSMLARFGRLCAPLGDALREIVIAVFPWDVAVLGALQHNPAETMYRLRDQMPRAVRRRLVLRMPVKARSEYGYDERESVNQHVFTCDSPYWRDIVLED